MERLGHHPPLRRLCGSERVGLRSEATLSRAFRSLKMSGLRVRPIFHWTETRVRAHLLLCMLAYYLEWHLRHQLASLLFSEEGEPQHPGRPVGLLQRTEVAKRKDRARTTLDGSLPVQGVADLLAGLGTPSAAELRYEQVPGCVVPTLSELEQLRERVFELLGFQPHPVLALSEPPDSVGNSPPDTPTACSKCGRSAQWRTQQGPNHLSD